MNDEERVPTTQRLAAALRAAGAPSAMVAAATHGYYDDFRSILGQSIVTLVQDAYGAGLEDIALRAIDGEFDAPDWEAEEWLHRTPDGQAVYQEFFGGPGPGSGSQPRRQWYTKKGVTFRQSKRR